MKSDLLSMQGCFCCQQSGSHKIWVLVPKLQKGGGVIIYPSWTTSQFKMDDSKNIKREFLIYEVSFDVFLGKRKQDKI